MKLTSFYVSLSGFYMIGTSILNELNNFGNFNLFHATGVLLYPLKTSEKERFSDVLRGV